LHHPPPENIKLILNYLVDNPEICAKMVKSNMEMRSDEVAKVLAGIYFEPDWN
jgi:hypothetical protein